MTQTNESTESSNDSTNSCISPQWLNAELFEKILRDTIPGYRKTISFKIEPGTGAGENYATIMLRLKFNVELEDGETKSNSLMIKVPHDSDIFRKLMENHNVFTTEREMYEDIVPEFEQLYRDAGVNVTFGAKSYKIEAPDEYVVLEDLGLKGFKNANRLEGLDILHTQCVLRKLAQWHAVSAVRVANKGPYSSAYTVGFFKETNRVVMEQMNKGLHKQFCDCLINYNGHEIYSENVKALQNKLTDSFFKLGQIDDNEFNVMNHGDCWSNNIMFQYDALGNIKETYFVDYQMPKYGTVAQDLLYFLLSSTKFEHKLSKFDYYIKYYHDNLIEHLKLLNYSKPLPTLRNIHATLLKNGAWGFGTVIGVMAAVLLEPTESANLDNFLSESDKGNDFKKLMYTNSRYCKHVEAIMPWLLYRGALDV